MRSFGFYWLQFQFKADYIVEEYSFIILFVLFLIGLWLIEALSVVLFNL